VSQTSTVARTRAAGPPAAAPATPQPHASQPPGTAPGGWFRRAFEGTPNRLRTAAAVGVLVSLVFALVGGNAFRVRGNALDEARADAAQLVRVQQIATDLTAADAVVTNAFLQGGQEPAGTYDQFSAYISDASTQLAEAAKAQPGDATALAAVNEALTQYTANVSAARVNNRFAFQTGSGYLRQASNLLRTPTPSQPAMLPTLQSVVAADAARVQDAFDDARLALVELAVAALVVLAGLAAVQIWLARRTRRILNIPMTWGTGAVLLTIVLGALAMAGSQRSANDVRDTHYAAARALAQARIAAYDAKANESLTLVYQGTGQAFETAYQKNLATARAQLAAAQAAGVQDPALTELNHWDRTHQNIRTLDNSGDWGRAVTTAVNQSPDGSTGQFQAFAAKTAPVLEREAAAVSDGLASSHWLLVLLGWLTLAVGIAAAVLAWNGVQQRLGEYR
jgi:hypothetical protein